MGTTTWQLSTCSHCKKKVISWSQPILQQLDVGHCLQFPAILTYKQACDLRVVCLLRSRGLGNGPFKLQRKLHEQHSEAWLQRTANYLFQCQELTTASERRLIPPAQPSRNPQQ